MKKKLNLLCILFTSFVLTNVDAAINISSSGYDGSSGSSGSPGWNATDGGHGGDGGNAKNILLTVTENGDSINLSGDVGQNAYNKAIKFFGETLGLYAQGGDGGNGGDGGDGYAGIDGRDGAPGRDGFDGFPGRDGRDGTRYQPNGEDGTDGGPGENGWPGFPGEDGGNGGHGGDGGSGGDGGNGGAIVLKYYDPAVLMHFSHYTSAGSSGSGGSAGIGGRGGDGGNGGRGGYGGMGGRGGDGGTGYNCTTEEETNGCSDGSDGRDGYRGSSGWNASSGRDGSDGYSGSSGSSGSGGSSGNSGNFRAQHINAAGQVLNELSSLANIYSLKVTTFNVVDENEDSIFEPGESFTITSVSVQNVGGMRMPQGAKLSFSKGGVEGDVLTLPTFEVNELKAFPLSVKGIVPAGSKLQDKLQVVSNLQFRGLSFKHSAQAFSYTVKRPLMIESISHEEYVPFDKTYKLIVKVKNISTKSYATGVVNFSTADKVTILETKKLGEIKSGAIDTAELEYTMKSGLEDFERASIELTLFREKMQYEKHDESVQVVPSYKQTKESDLLVLSNGFTSEAFKDVKKALSEANLKYDIYDSNLNGELGSSNYKLYENKVIFIAKYNKISSTVIKNLESFLAQKGGVAILNSESVVSSPTYRNRSVAHTEAFFKLSSSSRKEAVKKHILTVMPNVKKIAFIKSRYAAGDTTRMNLMKDYYQGDLAHEYRFAKDVENDIYDKGLDSFAERYASWYATVNPAKDFTLKLYLSGMVSHFLTFDSGGAFKVTYNKFKGLLGAAVDEYEDYANLKNTCGEIKGTYLDKLGHQLEVEATALGKNIKTKIMVGGEEVKLKAEKSTNMIWNFEYEVSKKDYIAVASMKCSGSYITLKLNLPHSGESWNLVKVKVD
jgi:hypothetical protein